MDKREEYFRRMQFEHELIDRRLTWLLTSETLLFAAYGISFGKSPMVLKTTAIVGLAISAAVFVGVAASLFAKRYVWLDFKGVPGNEKEQFWVRTWTTRMGFVPDLALPIVFAVAWMRLY